MAFKLKYIPLTLFIAINTLCVVAMNLCAYSVYLPPQTYPSYSYWGLIFPVFLLLNVLFVFFWFVFKRRCILIPVCGMLMCAWAVRAYIPFNINKEVPDGALKVMSYNVMMFGDDKDKSWNDKAITKYLLASGADIICLQELGGFDKAVEKGHVDIAAYPYHSLHSEANSSIGCLSKYPIVDSRVIPYPSKSNRSMAYDIVVGGDTLLVINNHLESYKLSAEDKAQYKELINAPKEKDAEEKYYALTDKLAEANKIRGPQAEAVAAFVKENLGKYRHIILCGDFNDSPLSYTHHVLTEHLNDAYTRAGNGPGLSYNRSGMYFRLDHILVSESVVPYKTVVDNSFSASDHYPIVSELGVRSEE